MVMLGIAAERVFLLLCEAVANALASPKEAKKFTDLCGRFSMKPKLDWVHEKFRGVEAGGPPGFPENAPLMVVAIYDLMRAQRNDLGHPREHPPAVRRGEAHANFTIFPAYYEAAERVRAFLAKNQI